MNDDDLGVGDGGLILARQGRSIKQSTTDICQPPGQWVEEGKGCNTGAKRSQKSAQKGPK